MEDTEFWRKCSACKKPIGYKTKYYVCSVSTCNGQRTGYVFCSVFCWEVHLPGVNHRSAGAIEKVSPEEASPTAGTSTTSAPITQPVRRLVSDSSNRPVNQAGPKEVLIVVSKMKDYIRTKSEMNCSGDVADVLSDFVRDLCDRAIDQARADGRKTVMGRDFPKR